VEKAKNWKRKSHDRGNTKNKIKKLKIKIMRKKIPTFKWTAYAVHNKALHPFCQCPIKNANMKTIKIYYRNKTIKYAMLKLKQRIRELRSVANYIPTW
jgi:hypothetical protein